MADRSFHSALERLDELQRRRAGWIAASEPTRSAVGNALALWRSRRRTRRGMLLSFACGAGLVLAVVAMRAPTGPAPREPQAPRLALAERSFSLSGCSWTNDEHGLVVEAGCQLGASDLVMEAQTRARIGAIGRDIDLRSGRMQFEVRPREPGDLPFSVHTPVAVAEVIGTRFTVEHQGTRSRIHVERGRVRWHAQGAAPVELGAGEHATAAPDTAQSAPPVQARTPSPSASPKPEAKRQPMTTGALPREPPTTETRSIDPEQIMASVRRMVLEGQPRAALREIDDALASEGLDPRVRRVLAYERGRILQFELRDATAACGSWAAYEREFPSGDYANEVRLAKRQAGCR